MPPCFIITNSYVHFAKFRIFNFIYRSSCQQVARWVRCRSWWCRATATCSSRASTTASSATELATATSTACWRTASPCPAWGKDGAPFVVAKSVRWVRYSLFHSDSVWGGGLLSMILIYDSLSCCTDHMSQYAENCSLCFCFAGELRCMKVCESTEFQVTVEYRTGMCDSI